MKQDIIYACCECKSFFDYMGEEEFQCVWCGYSGLVKYIRLEQES